MHCQKPNKCVVGTVQSKFISYHTINCQSYLLTDLLSLGLKLTRGIAQSL